MSEPFRSPIDGATRYCAVLGHPVRHSASPAMQNAGLAALRLNWRYLAFDVNPDDLPAVLEGARRMNFIGLNLTVPHKVLAFELMDTLDVSAQAWGTVNTVRFEGKDSTGEWCPVGALEAPSRAGRAQGFNTDADAIIQALQEDVDFRPAGKKVLLLGAGGAGRTAALKLAAEGAEELYLVNRTPSKAEVVAAEIRQRFPAVMLKLNYPTAVVDLVLNATSLGLKPDDPLPFDVKRFSLTAARAAFDMIYRPVVTPFLELAKQAGCRASNGLGMLLYQGVKALEIWTGKPAPIEVMRRALRESVYGVKTG